MSLLDFVEDDDRIRLAADGFGQLTGFIIADITRRSTNQAADAVAFHEFGHVNLNQGVFGTKHLVSQGFRKLSFANTGRSKEHERPDWSVFTFESCPGTADSL